MAARFAMRPALALLAVAALATACQKRSSAEAEAPAPAVVAAKVTASAPVDSPDAAAPMAGDDALDPCPEGEGDELQRARAFYDQSDFAKALQCAAQAAAADPEDPSALSERAAALSALDRLEEAQVVYARALALDPDHADALLGAADLFLNRLPPSRDHNELALAYANRGHEGAREKEDLQLAGLFALQAAQALNGLGRCSEAVELADAALAAAADERMARLEKGLALWELCRFAEARREFQWLLREDPSREALAHHYLGLLAERDGEFEVAERQFEAARRTSPEEYPPEVDVSPAEFEKMVRRAVGTIPESMRRDLSGIPLDVAEIPDLEDLTAGEPPLSPEIVGLYRGPPLSEECLPEDLDPGPCRSIVLYRRNLIRSVSDVQELERQVRITIIHEVGHLRGEDDVQLAARGLE